MWVPVEETRCLGVVKWHFENEPLHSLRVWIGETVRIRGETKDWFLVTKIGTDETGIVPKSHIHVQESYVLPGDSHHDGLIIPRQPPLVQEITDVLKEWHRVAKELYYSGDLNTFNMIKNSILQLHSCRSTSITSLDLTVDGRRELKKTVAEIIDTGNNLLKLDMCVRDEAGNTLNSKLSSTVELFRQHQRSCDKLNKKSGLTHSTSGQTTTLWIGVTCTRITWRIVDECQVRFYLYDADEDAVFTEGTLMTLTASQQQNSFANTRFLFTDLGTRDVERNRVYLIVYIVRIGAMEFKEEKQASSSLPFSQYTNKSTQSIRRPWGVGAQDITHLITNKADFDSREKWHITVPFMPVSENDYLKSAVKKLIETDQIPDKGCFQCAINLIVRTNYQGDNFDLPSDDSLLSTNGSIVRDIIVRKMGFPEVILPTDVRNELYITLSTGEFHRGSKSADKNVQVTMSCHNERGELIKGILYSGSRSSRMNGRSDDGTDYYNSVVYYHDDKPNWHETVKVSLPMAIEEFSNMHIKFTFKHRSSNDSKDKQEKPFALAYLKLRLDKGTAVWDGEHKLKVYKIDHKQYRENDTSYLALLSLSTTTNASQSQQSIKSSCPGLSWSQKDSFLIHTILCSTKFTQNEHLLDLLQWSSTTQGSIAKLHMSKADMSERRDAAELILKTLSKTLSNVVRISGEEIVKFLPDIFDALFFILVKPVESVLNDLMIGNHLDILAKLSETKETCDEQIFQCLIYIFEVVLNPKYQKFKSVLSHYIEDGFTATLAYKKLIKELYISFQNPVPDKEFTNKILRIMKSFEFFFRFIIRSFSIRRQLERMEVEVIEREGEQEAELDFEQTIVNLFKSMCLLVQRKEPNFLTAQGSILRYLPSIIEPISTVFNPMRLSELLVDLIRWVPPGQLNKEKLTTIGEIIKSSLFRHPDCRTTLLPIITTAIREHLPGNDNEMRRRFNETTKTKSKKKTTQILGEDVIGGRILAESSNLSTHSDETLKSVELLSDMMDILFRKDIGAVPDNITYIMHILLAPIIHSISAIGEKDQLAGNMVAILLSLFRQMTKRHYLKLITNLRVSSNGEAEFSQFINDILVTLKTLSSISYFPSTWSEMILLQNYTILTVLKYISDIIKTEEKFNEVIWNNYFSCIVSFLIQESLSLEHSSQVKKFTVLNSYGDMRREASDLVHLMWFSMGQSKRIKFVPYMVGTFLEMGFVNDVEIQKTVVQIFFDMLRCEFDEFETICKMEDELVKRLVELIESGRGDYSFRVTFETTIYQCCQHDNTGLQEIGLRMIEVLSRLIDLLLEYRQVLLENNEIGNTMNCIVNLLDFSMEIDRKGLYFRYLYKLHEFHVKCGNFTEAAFTLKLHSRQLEWTDEELPIYLKSPLYPLIKSQWELKETIYYDIINYFDKAKMWECALDVCDELRSQYAEETYNYTLLSSLLSKMASFYNNILKGIRCEPEYFRVAFFGTSFPTFLQRKAFIYRGKEYEKLSEFEARMLERFPKAELLRTLNQPSDEITNSSKQYLQICKVDPMLNNNSKRMSGMKYADEAIKKYYRSNNVNKFVFSRPYHREPKDPTNEFASLWLDRYTLWSSNSFPGILSWFPVIKETSQQIKPIVKAIETMEEANDKLKEMVLSHSMNPNEDLGGLTMKLSGILDAAVMGGIANYEAAFLTPSYLEREPQDSTLVDRLKTLICNQVPIVYQCLLIHEKKAPESLQELHKHLQKCYDNLIRHMHEAYGVSLQNVQDDLLARDVDRATRRRLVQSVRYEEPTPKIDHVQARHGITSGSSILRGKGSFSSTISLYSTSKMTGKSMNALSKAQRRSTQSSIEEVININSSKLASSSKLDSPQEFVSASGNRDSNPFFPSQQSNSRTNGYVQQPGQRRSFTWTDCNSLSTPNNRNSTHSLPTISGSQLTIQSTTSETLVDSNSHSPAPSTPLPFQEQEHDPTLPPPLPPKTHHPLKSPSPVPGPGEQFNDSRPTPPPKPPLRHQQ